MVIVERVLGILRFSFERQFVAFVMLVSLEIFHSTFTSSDPSNKISILKCQFWFSD